LLLTIAVRRYADMRTGAAHAALVAERERIARDLHDGLAQDLAFIAAHGERLAAQFGAEHPLVIAARRALAVSRGTIVDLSASTAPTTAGALLSVADELERRFQVKVDVDVAGAADGGAVELDPVDREAVVRIAREAMVNAIKHGEASRISVELGSLQSARLLRVTDDGCGIGRPVARSCDGSGVGLPTMRARAESLGGRLVARPGPAGGTQVEVLVS
jgi:signal transduction histidine kinase